MGAYEEAARIFKALSDENRLQILEMLMKEEMNAGQLLASVDLAQSTLSHHMKLLTESGLVEARRDGKWTWYRLSVEMLDAVIGSLRVLAGDVPAADGECENASAAGSTGTSAVAADSRSGEKTEKKSGDKAEKKSGSKAEKKSGSRAEKKSGKEKKKSQDKEKKKKNKDGEKSKDKDKPKDGEKSKDKDKPKEGKKPKEKKSSKQ